ncbi:hypothetical protein ACRQ1B_18180 [Rhizobium panacihumi]|uniref:hypothetical protein n=1 Tax=Rhizobium panacihumi TaxID=2008450 RepID=UPI003D7BEEE6
MLVEFGVAPALLGVERLFASKCLQREEDHPIILPAAPYAAISRPNLEAALAKLTERARIRIEPQAVSAASIEAIASDAIVFDATGRRAISARKRWRPTQPIVARSFHFAGVGPAREGLALAAGPNGYVYRVANRNGICLGVVGHGHKSNWDDARDRIASFAPWIVSDLTAGDLLMTKGRSGPTSLQWAEAGACAILIGDAELSRDAMSSQGLAIGLGAAIVAVSQALTDARPGPPAELAHERSVHARRTLEQIAATPFSRDHTWRQYGGFLGQTAASSCISEEDISPKEHTHTCQSNNRICRQSFGS